jgi:hypothetical protein
MLQTVEAVIDEDGHVRLLESVRLPAARRALITILEESPVLEVHPYSRPPVSDGDVAIALAAVDQTRGTVALDIGTVRWVAEDKDLEYGAPSAG